MLRILLALCFALTVSAFGAVSPNLAMSKVVSSRMAEVSMLSGARSSAPKKKATAKRGSSTEGKGGIFPWVTNQPGTYAKPLMLSSVNFLGDEGDSWIGWGFMPNSVKNLYNPN